MLRALPTLTPVLSPQHRAVMYMIYGLLAVLASMGLLYLMIILSHCLLLYSVALAKQRWLCYVAGLCCLASFKVEPFGSWQVGPVCVSAPFPAHWCPSPWGHPPGGLLGQPQALLTISPGCIRALTAF